MDEPRVELRGKRDPSLPKIETSGEKATYSWDNPAERQMRKYGVDFRPPWVAESWNWVMDNSQVGSDRQWLPGGEKLEYRRHALLLEYLPDARSMNTQSITRDLAFQALAGAQAIQKALVMHHDLSSHNLLLTSNGKAIWVDFDRATVLDSVPKMALVDFKRDLIEIYEILFRVLNEVSLECST